MKYTSLIFIIPIFLMSSCQSYKSCFDCPPGEGVPCTSVSDLEKMIIETDQGADVFVGQDLNKNNENPCCSKQSSTPFLSKKIWISNLEDSSGMNNQYIYVPD